MKWSLKRDLFILVVMLLFAVGMVLFYSSLPETVPSHFNTDGVADKWSPKSTLLLLGLAMPVAVYVVLTFIPFIDPFKKRFEQKYNIFLIFRDLVIVFLVYDSIVIQLSTGEGRFQTSLFGVGFGLLFVLLGNYLPKLPRNFFFGIRSPWTLASEVVWKKTHIVSGWLFVAAGFVIIVLSLAGIPLHTVLLGVLVPVILVSAFIYPYLLYRKLQHEGNTNVPEL